MVTIMQDLRTEKTPIEWIWTVFTVAEAKSKETYALIEKMRWLFT